jgi:hypothetical protein
MIIGEFEGNWQERSEEMNQVDAASCRVGASGSHAASTLECRDFISSERSKGKGAKNERAE